jgi:hypothetical protein
LKQAGKLVEDHGGEERKRRGRGEEEEMAKELLVPPRAIPPSNL